MESINHLHIFFESFKKLGFWQRLFSWAAIREVGYAAWEELVQLTELVRNTNEEKATLLNNNQLLHQENASLQRQAEEARMSLVKMEAQAESNIQRLNTELKQTAQFLREKENVVLKYEQNQVRKEEEYQARWSKALAVQELFDKERKSLQNERLKEVEDYQEKQRLTWSEHEKAVQKAMRKICVEHGIEYVTEFAFRGRPDNAIRVADETIVFDAKSPARDDLGNFKSYIKQQVEAAKKYAVHDGVRKDIYLVVPTNAVGVLDTLSFDTGTYRVYVITLDALEPVMLTLKQIEAYDFVDQLSPEERQSICRVIGSLIYASKRRVQVDQFFNGHLLELIAKVQRELPESMQEDIGKNEKAMILNPPTDKRTKEINTETLLKSHNQVKAQAEVLDAPTPLLIEIVNA